MNGKKAYSYEQLVQMGATPAKDQYTYEELLSLGATPAPKSIPVPSPPPEKGFIRQTLSRLKETYLPERTVPLPEAIGLEGLRRQYGTEGSVWRQPTISAGLTEAIPFVGPSINEAVRALAQGRPKEASAIVAADIAVPALAGKVVGKTGRGIAKVAEASATKNWMDILKKGVTEKTVPLAEELAPKLAKERVVAPSAGALRERALAERKLAGPPTETAYAGKAGVHPAQLIFGDLEYLRAKMTTVKGTKVEVSKAMGKQIDNYQEMLMDMADDLGRINPVSLDDLRDKLFRGLVTGGGYQAELPPMTLKKLQQSLARAIKRELDERYPDAARVNATYHLWSQTANFMEKMHRREVAASTQGLRGWVREYLPFPIRFAITLPLDVMSVFHSVPWNTISSATKMNFAKAIASADWERATNAVGAYGVVQPKPPSPPPTPKER